MSDLFRSAFNYISQAPTQLLGGLSGIGADHPLVGQTVEINDERLRVRSLLAEGGYALVFAVQDQKGQWYALKRQLAVDRQAAEAVVREIKFLRELSGHPSIIKYCQATQVSPKQTSHGHTEFLLLTELCSGGPLIDVMQKQPFTTEQICKIFHAVAAAVQHMHDRNPPITHRDLKIENLLIDERGFIKLCDFGSATTDIYRPNDEWNAMRRTQLEEDMAKYTTPMYRAPEILDTYQNFPIGPAQDIWALGCVLFYLCYRQHPFEDSAKLRIINAKYTLPEHSPFSVFHSLIRSTLEPVPYSRISIMDLFEQVEDVALALNVNLHEPVFPPNEVASILPTSAVTNGQSSSSSSQQQSQPTEVGGTFASQLKDQGISLFKTFKEKSSAAAGISEHIKTQFGFDTVSQRQSPASTPSRTHSAPSRPPPPRPPNPSQFPQKQPHPSDALSNLLPQVVCQRQQPEAKKSSHQFLVDPFDGTSAKKEPQRKQQPPADDFFSSLNWGSTEPGAATVPPEPPLILTLDDFPRGAAPPTPPPLVPAFDLQAPRIPTPDYPRSLADSEPSASLSAFSTIVQVDDNDLNDPDPCSEIPSLSGSTRVIDFEAEEDEQFLIPEPTTSADVFHHQEKQPHSSADLVNLLDGWSEASAAASMIRNASAPDFEARNWEKKTSEGNEGPPPDPFTEFLEKQTEALSSQNRQHEQKPNYSRTNFAELFPEVSNPKPARAANTFDDILSSQGFISSTKQSQRSLADMGREQEISGLDPLDVKIRDWTKGKERNIRALLGSLADVIWDEARMNWSQPSMADLLSDIHIKKHYRRACLVVHPDKQTGTENEALAKKVFTELNDAWNEFESSKK